eukprot:546227-Pleurochrysis_carterae.AAC.1
MRWPLEKCANLVNADAGPITRELLLSTEMQAHLHLEPVPNSPRAAKASAGAAREGVIPTRLTSASDREGVASTFTMYTFNFFNVLTSFASISV